jgi:hypothetical protein
LGGKEELRIVLKKPEDIEAFRRVKVGMSGVGVSNVEVVRRLIGFYHELLEIKEREKEEKNEEERAEVEGEEDADDVELLQARLRKAQGIILRRRLELERMEEYLRAAERRLMFHVAGRWPRRVWRLYLILLDALRRRGAFKAFRMRRNLHIPQSLFAKDVKLLVELGLLERLHWGVYRISYIDKENLLRELCIRLARRDIELHVNQESGEEPA